MATIMSTLVSENNTSSFVGDQLTGPDNIVQWQENFKSLAELKGLWECFSKEAQTPWMKVKPTLTDPVFLIEYPGQPTVETRNTAVNTADRYDKTAYTEALRTYNTHQEKASKAWGLIKLAVCSEIRVNAAQHANPLLFYEWLNTTYKPSTEMYLQVLWSEWERLKPSTFPNMAQFLTKITDLRQRITEIGGVITLDQTKAKAVTTLGDAYTVFKQQYWLLSDNEKNSWDKLQHLLIQAENALPKVKHKVIINNTTYSGGKHGGKKTFKAKKQQKPRCHICGVMHGNKCLVLTGEIPNNWTEDAQDRLRERIKQHQATLAKGGQANDRQRSYTTPQRNNTSNNPNQGYTTQNVPSKVVMITLNESVNEVKKEIDQLIHKESVKGAIGKTTPECYTIDVIGKTPTNTWILDSGANTHMCNNTRLFTKYRAINGGKASTASRNNKFAILGVGTVQIPMLIANQVVMWEVSNTYYAPSLRYNILSVSELWKSPEQITGTWRDEITLFTKNGIVIGYADWEHGVWKLRAFGAAKLARVLPLSEGSMPLEVNSVITDHNTLTHWHRRMGHLHFNAVKNLTQVAEGVNIIPKDQQWEPKGVCECCILAKGLTRLPGETQSHATRPLERLIADVWGPYIVTGSSLKQYFILLGCEKTRYLRIKITLNRSSIHIADWLDKEIGQMQNIYGHTVCYFRTDFAKEFRGQPVQDVLNKWHIKWEHSVPYAHHQIGMVERANNTIANMVRAMLVDSHLPQHTWAELAKTAVYIRNRSPTRVLDGMTPYEALTGKKPNLQHLRIIGSAAYCQNVEMVQGAKRKKLDARFRKCRLVGYGNGSNQYVVWDPNTNRIELVSSPKIDESDSEVSDEEIVTSLNEEIEPQADNTTDPEWTPATTPNSISSSKGISRMVEVSIPKININKDDYINIGLVLRDRHEGAKVLLDPEPLTQNEALTSPESEYWQKAMKEEFDSLLQNNTWELVPLPIGRKALDTKWVYKRKDMPDVLRYKARLVVKGFLQRHGVDFDETWASVVKPMTFRLLYALAAKHHWFIRQGDVKTAFLNGEISENVYIKQPLGFEQKGRPLTLVCKLNKALYGLKQSARAWYKKIKAKLEVLGFTTLGSDDSTFVSADKSVIVTLYVDDIQVFGGDLDSINTLEEQIRASFEMTPWEESKFYIGLNVTHNREKGLVHLDMSKHITRTIQRLGYEVLKPVNTPMKVDTHLKKSTGEATPEDISDYSAKAGSLNWIAIAGRPDLANTASTISEFMSNPDQSHFDAIERAFAYLNTYPHLGPTFGMKKGTQLTGWVDSTWADDSNTRRSKTGYVFMFEGGPVSWKSQLQKSVALSSAEAEYVAVGEAAKEAMFLRSVMNDIVTEKEKVGCVKLMEDNQSCIRMSVNPEFHSRTKHIDIRHHFIRQLVEDNSVKLEWVPTNEQIADGLTKPLAKDPHWRFVTGIGLTDRPPK